MSSLVWIGLGLLLAVVSSKIIDDEDRYPFKDLMPRGDLSDWFHDQIRDVNAPTRQFRRVVHAQGAEETLDGAGDEKEPVKAETPAKP